MTDTFDLNSGGGNTGFSFGPQGSQPGASITGTVVDMKEVQKTNFDTRQPEFWDNGDPKMQIRLTLQTQLRDPSNPNDNGVRDVYLDGKKKPHDNGAKSRICAVLDAVRAATGGTQIARNGTVTITWVSGMGFSGDPRGYTATYQPPALDLATAGQAPAAQPTPQTAPTQQGNPWPQQQPVQQAAPTQQAPVQAAPAQQAAAPSPTGPTLEAVAAVKAAGMDPAVVFAGQQLPAGA